MRISDWSSDVCSSDLSPTDLRGGISFSDSAACSNCNRAIALPASNPANFALPSRAKRSVARLAKLTITRSMYHKKRAMASVAWSEDNPIMRSEEHTSELQSLMRISYAVFCLKKKRQHSRQFHTHQSIQIQSQVILQLLVLLYY